MTDLLASRYAAYDSIGASVSGWFMWGLPFCYGRNVYTVANLARIGSQPRLFVAFQTTGATCQLGTGSWSRKAASLLS